MVKLLTNRTCVELQFNAMRHAFDFAEMSRTHTLVEFQHGEDRLVTTVFLDVGKVDHVFPVLWRLCCLWFSIYACVLRREYWWSG